jgi:disulfide bond formation protein DsbB
LKTIVTIGNKISTKVCLSVLLGLIVSATIVPSLLGTQGILTVALAQPANPDFNGDGFKDLAIAAPFEDVGPSAISNAGAVNVIYGSATGLAADGNQIWTQNSPGILDVAEPFDNFGSALTIGDFNNDGYSDLAVGAPREAIGATNEIVGAGAVNVIYGSASGLTTDGNQVWTQNTPGILDEAEMNFDPDTDDDDRIPDRFGNVLTSGDFNSDGYDDLAVGVPGESVQGATEIVYNAGAVNIIYGSASGLTADGNQVWTQETPDVLDDAEFSDFFGSVLTSSDFNGDGYDDLAVGTPGENIGTELGTTETGEVQIIFGSASGLTAEGNQLWTQDVEGVLDSAEELDRFGAALMASDFNNDGYGDLAVGIPNEDLAEDLFTNEGAVQVMYGSASGLTAEGNQFWTQESIGILDGAELFDNFGSALAASDFNNDGYGDLAVGIPSEDVGMTPTMNAGAVQIIYGSASGLAAEGNQIFAQNSPGIIETASENDLFGSAIATGDFNNDGYGDLAVGIPAEDLGAGPATNTGAVQIIYSSASGLTAEGNQLWSQNSPGILDTSGAFDLFGRALT